MCGIAGIFAPLAQLGSRDEVMATVKRMTDAIAHRGPDGEGHFVTDRVALGHRRLAIVDLHAGQQPLWNNDRTVCVVFNGEIYNYKALSKELSFLGYKFATQSDTEVIVHAWSEWGERCLSRFQGMFTFVLWDIQTSTLFCARDRLGVKPFYYGMCPKGNFHFGSELKALIASRNFRMTLNDQAVEDYFALGYVPENKSIYQQVTKLEPAHYLLWKVGQKAPQITRYWHIEKWNDRQISEKQAIEELRELTSDAVQLRMNSDVPYGAFLSGGVDSSIVVASMAEQSTQPIKTCAIGFGSAAFDETEYAQRIATKFKTDHLMHRVESDDFFMSAQLAKSFDEPFADSSAIPTFRVAQFARKSVTMALSGDGGDEMFGGYRRYWMNLGENRIRNFFPTSLGQGILRNLSRVYPKADWAPRPMRAKSTLMAASMGQLEAYEQSISVIRPALREPIYSADFKAKLAGYRVIQTLKGMDSGAPEDPLARLQYLDYQSYLPSDINVKVDRMSMANSLEVRAPFLDYRLVEWAARLPSSFKIETGSGKKILKKAFLNEVGADIMYRPKQGFSVPIATWFRGPLKSQMNSLVQNSKSVDFGYLDPQMVRLIVEQHQSNHRDHSTSLWAIWMFEQFLDQAAV